MEVDGASLKEEAAYTDACAGDGTVTDYSDVITVENSNTGLGYLVDSCVSGYFWEIGGYDAEGYAIYVLPGYDATLYNITFNIATSQWEMDWGTYDNGIVFTSTGGYTIDCNDTSTVSIQSGFYCNDPGEQVFSCYDTNSGEDVYTLERTFTATDGCNESSCTVTYTWTEQSAQATSTADASEDALPQTPAPISSSSQAAPGEGEDMGVDLDFTAFPVPFDRDVNVKFNFEFDTDVTIEVHDTRGLLVKSMTLNNVRANTEIKKSFDLSRAGDQLFYITVTTNQGSVTKKAVSSNMKRR